MTEQKSAKQLLLPVFVTVFIDMLGATIVLPILAPLLTDLSTGILPVDTTILSIDTIESIKANRNLIFGLLIAIFPFAQFFGAPLLGAWADKVGRKRVLLISLIGTFIGYVLFAVGIEFALVWLLFVARALDGFTGGNISIAFSAISDVSKPENKAKNFGLVSMAFALGFIVGPVLGGVFSDSTISSYFSFQTPFIIASVLCILNLVLVKKYFFETLKKPSTKPFNLVQGFENIFKAFRSKKLQVLFLIMFLVAFGFNLFTQFLQVFFIEKFNYSVSDIGYFFAFVGVWIAFTQGYLIGKLGKKFAANKIVALGCLGLSITIIAYVFPTKSYMLYFLAPFIAMTQGVIRPNLLAMISNKVSDEEQGEIMGINQSVQSLGMMIPPVIAGFIVSVNVHLPIILASVFILLAFLTTIFFYNKKQPHEIN